MVHGRHRSIGAVLAVVLLCTAFPLGEAQAEPSAETIARGKALAEAADCASCHTADPSKPFAGGKRIDTPFGAIYSPNLTPDRETGLGAWSDEEFSRALRYGVRRDGSRYYPAFPYPNFTKMVRDDLLAIRAYLATLTPVPNSPPPPELRWPLNYRIVMRAWNYLFFRPGIFEPNQQKSTEWNRGGYLVTGAAHCGACHTPKNLFGGDRGGPAFGGGRVLGWFAPRPRRPQRSGPQSRQRQSAVGCPLQHPAYHPRRCADRDDAARAQSRIDAGLRQAVVGSRDRRCHKLHPQFLGQCRAAGDAGAGEEGAERKIIHCVPDAVQRSSRCSAEPGPYSRDT